MTAERRSVLKQAEVTGKVRTVIEREAALTSVLEECDRLLAEAEAKAAEIEKSAQEAAHRTVAQARQEAGRLRREAETQCETLRRQAREAGSAEGDAAARAAVRAEVGDLIDRLTGLVRQAQECLQQLIADHEPEIVRLSLEVAGEIVDARIAADDDVVRRVVTRALERAGDRETVTLRVNPEDFEQIQYFVPELRNRFADVGAMSVEPDPGVERGGCVVRTRLGTVDARIARQKARLRDVLLEG